MWAVITRELKNYFKNPCFWIGFVFILCYIGQMLAPYLRLHYFAPGEEIAEVPWEMLGDADVMDGYIPAQSDEQKREYVYTYLEQTFRAAFGYSEEEAALDMEIIRQKQIPLEELDAYIGEHYGLYYFVEDLLQKDMICQGTVEEVNGYIEKKMGEHPYSFYFAEKFADFAGLFLGFFAAVLLAFLYVRDMKSDTYELLHTKPLSAHAYVCGKAAGGFFVMLAALCMLNVVFGVWCWIAGAKNHLPVRFLDVPLASLLYIVPNLLMIVCVYTVVALLFKNPYPAMPLLFLYMLYSNMGSVGPDGNFGYYGRPLAIMVRFPGNFLEIAPPPYVLWNQLFLLAASALALVISFLLWKRRCIA